MLFYKVLRNSQYFSLSCFKFINKRSIYNQTKMENSFTSKYVPGQIPKIELTEKETQIINLLNKYTRYYNDNEFESNKKITLRITGGWVRDKLLNHPSHDIDIGIDNCSGESFVMGLKDWLDDIENKTNNQSEEEKEKETDTEKEIKIEKDTTKINTIHKIKKNPDKSKHLETCTTKLFGLDIDFVNLRSESYTSDSRIPTITTGTPVEDAFRRDATLNALFFNLSTMKIEDLTGKGLNDLANGILRTPLEPTKTFLDDPLRCLRLIRFASNYGFKIDKLTINSMKEEKIKIALETKISRERIGVEIRKIIINKRGMIGVLSGLELIKEVDFSCIFDLGDTKINDEEWLIANKKHLNDDILLSIGNKLKYLPKLVEKGILNFDIILNEKIEDENDKILFYSSLILNKWGSLKVKVGKKENEVSFYCVLNGIKMPLRIAENVALFLNNVDKFKNKLNELNDGVNFKRSEIAQNFILPFKDKWELNFLINYCIESFENFDYIEEITIKYSKLSKLIYELKLENSYNEQVLLNGKDLMKIANKKPGPWLRPVTDQLLVWQLDNPTSSKEDMIEYLHTII